MSGAGRKLLGAFHEEAAAIVDAAREEIARSARDGVRGARRAVREGLGR
jgi:hypothetical protein